MKEKKKLHDRIKKEMTKMEDDLDVQRMKIEEGNMRNPQKTLLFGNSEAMNWMFLAYSEDSGVVISHCIR
jgi:hypothetical protein